MSALGSNFMFVGIYIYPVDCDVRSGFAGGDIFLFLLSTDPILAARILGLKGFGLPIKVPVPGPLGSSQIPWLIGLFPLVPFRLFLLAG